MNTINEKYLKDENYKGFYVDPMKDKIQPQGHLQNQHKIQSIDLRSEAYRGFPTDNYQPVKTNLQKQNNLKR